MEKVEIAVVGAGLAGLSCAQQLRQAGYAVMVLEKSRGLGGRAATRRLGNTCADHGLRYLEAQGDRSQALIDRLLGEGVIVPWTNGAYTLNEPGQMIADAASPPRYAAPAGMSAIAKPLAIDLDVRRNQRVVAISPTSQGWELTIDSIDSAGASTASLVARSIVMAIPAPQALALLEPLAHFDSIQKMCVKLRSVQFDPCITAIAVYPTAQSADRQPLFWAAVTLAGDPILKWIGNDSSKRCNPAQPVIVFHSTAAFAQQNFDAPNLEAIGQQMLDRAAQRLTTPWLNRAELLQVHRWRYAFVTQPLTEFCLISQSPLPIACCGEWCGGQQIEAALTSGAIAANQIARIYA